MQRFIEKLSFVHYFLAALLVGEAAPLGALAQEQIGQIENVRVQINGRSSVYIDYDLIGPTDRVFRVAVTMRKESDSNFSYIPQNVAGDIGPNVFPGRNNRIVWSLAKEFPEGIKEGEFYFVFTLESDEPSSTGVGTPLLIAGGAALVGGVLALVLLSKKSDNGGGNSTSSFPQPPGRP